VGLGIAAKLCFGLGALCAALFVFAQTDSTVATASALNAFSELQRAALARTPDQSMWSSQRQAGYRESLMEAGIAFDPELVRDGGYKAALTADSAHELLTRPDRPTAVFAANDMSALGVLAVARELGLRVPEDLSVIGFDDIPEAARSTPPLTTLAQPLHDLGAQALRMLIELLDGKEVPSHVQLPAELIVRASTGPAPHP